MLKLMRENAGSWIIKILLGVVVLVFIFLGIGPDRSGNQNIAAVVNKKVISVDEYRNAYSNVVQSYRRQFGDSLNDEFIKMLNLKSNTLESLIDRQLILQEAERYGIKVTDDEVRNLIRGISYFQENGQFDPQRYSSYIRYRRQSPEFFELMQRNELMLQKFQSLVFDVVPVSDGEAKAWYAWEKMGVRIAYVLFKTEAFKDLAPTDEAITAYYEKNADHYRAQPQVRTGYLFFSPDEYKKNLTITDKELEDYYTANKQNYDQPKTVEARHILIKVQEDAPDDLVEKKRLAARNVYQMAITDGQDFNQLAQTYSEDTSKDQGGYLGTFEQGQMVKPFSDQAFSMKAGEISEPIRTRFGWHVIKVEAVNEAKTPQLAEVKADIEERLIRQKAENLAYEQADLVFDEIISGSTMDQAAQMSGLPLINSGWFNENAGPAGIDAADRSRFTQAAFELEENGISDILDLSGRYYILQVTGKKGADIQPLDEVKARVTADLIGKMKEDKAKEAASSLIASIKEEATTLDAQADVQKTPVLNRDSRGTDAGIETAVVRAAFDLNDEKPLLDEPVKGTNGYYVIRLIDRTEPDPAGFDAEKERIRSELADKKKAQVYSRWLSQLKAQSSIERNHHLLE